MSLCFYKYIACKEERIYHRGRVSVTRPNLAGGFEETFLGHGRVLLLERIKKYGSISQAARSMEMSFKHAKDLVDSMTRQAGCTLVVTARDGKKAGDRSLLS
ncbi:MAG: hypothetical protein ABIJ50_10010 [Pseudomonadota bacterium]